MKSICFIIAILTAATVRADPPPPPVLMRVDQAVGDLDRLSLSLRTIAPGLHPPTSQSALFVPVTVPWANNSGFTTPLAGPVPYYRMAPGFRARIDRPDYLIPLDRHHVAKDITPIRDGRYLEKIPANTIFELEPYFPSPVSQTHRTGLAPGSSAPDMTDHRLPTLQVDNRIDRRVKPLVIKQGVAPPQ